MLPTDRAAFYEQMLRARRQAVATALGPRPAAGGVRASEDDQAQALQHEAVSVRLNNLGYEQLRLIQEALDRLAAGDYGACAECDSPIPLRRLEAVPWARYCVPCQQRMDEMARTSRELPELAFERDSAA
ncbi:MAG TPA: TraR/DksA family transcriptional regulator [Bryobacteraceae bacterium]|nr:TraR/DksA family transcriptional regulator [Bryobacteraceae bacterium]